MDEALPREILDGGRPGWPWTLPAAPDGAPPRWRRAGSPEMLARARRRVPTGAFHRGDLHRLPLAGGTVDPVGCCLALTHVPRLEPVLAEFARVLRPGGAW